MSSLTEATKTKIPSIISSMNTFGAPQLLTGSSGEGSTFLAIPIKRISHPRRSSQPEQQYLDFKRALQDRLMAVISPEDRRSSICSVSSEKNPLMPTDQQWYQLNQLRIHAGSPERTEKGVELLMNYYAQLCWLEEKFPFDTDEVGIIFSWYEACFPKKKVETTCIQYEKVAVMWNIAAIYSQLGSIESLWTQDGLRRAAQYFQKAAGAFIHARDHLVPRMKSKVDASSDLSDYTLTAASELMLAQAVECFYLKAEDDNTSSPVTSQIAIQAADYYDIAYKSAKLNNSIGKFRFPKSWTTQMHVKQMIHLAAAHYHCPNFNEADSVVGERHARLLLAKDFASKAVEKASANDVIVSPELRVAASSMLDRIQRDLNQVDNANFMDFHQTVLRKEALKPLRRPPRSLVSRIDVINSNGIGSVQDYINSGKIEDVFKSVVAAMFLSAQVPSFSRRVSEDVRQRSKELPVAFANMAGSKQESMQSLVNNMNEPLRKVSVLPKEPSMPEHNLPPNVLEDIKRFVWDTKKFYDQSNATIEQWKQRCEFPKDGDVEALNIALMELEPIDKTLQILERAEKLLKNYQGCYNVDQSKSTLFIFQMIQRVEQEITQLLQDASRALWDSDGEFKQLLHKAQNEGRGVKELMALRHDIQKLMNQWNCADEPDNQEPLLNSLLRQLREKLEVLTTEVKEDGFLELFSSSSQNGAASDLFWTLTKIQMVIPCMDEEWKNEYYQAKQKLSSLVTEITKQPVRKGESLSEVLSTTVEFLQGVTQISKRSSIELANFSQRLTELNAQWFKDESIWKQSMTSSILDQLVALGKTELKLRGNDNASHVDVISAGVSAARNEVYSLNDELKRACEAYKVQLLGISNPLQFRAEFYETINKLKSSVPTLVESERIIVAFEEQIKRWKSWRKRSEVLTTQLVDTRIELEEKFSQLLQRRRPSTISRTENFDKSVSDLLLEQEEVTKRQIEQAAHIASITQQSYQVQENQFHNALQKIESPATPRRQDMMRRLSVTASAIERQARDIEDKFKSDNITSQSSLLKSKEELRSQIRLLQDQQREFLRLHEQHMAWMTGSRKASYDARAAAETRRGSELLQKVKKGIKNIISRRASKEDVLPVEKRASIPEVTFNHPPPPPSAPQIPADHLIEENIRLKQQLAQFHEQLINHPIQRKKSISRKPVPPVYPSAEKTSMYDNDEDDVASKAAEYQLHRLSISRQSLSRKTFTRAEEPVKAFRRVSHAAPPADELTDQHPVPPPRRRSLPQSRLEHIAKQVAVDDIPVERLKLKHGMESVSKYFAWNRVSKEDYATEIDDDTLEITRRGSLGGGFI